MEVLNQLQTELKEAIKKKKELIRKVREMDFYINVFRKEVSLRKN